VKWLAIDGRDACMMKLRSAFHDVHFGTWSVRLILDDSTSATSLSSMGTHTFNMVISSICVINSSPFIRTEVVSTLWTLIRA
jgi:hypothetical protein